MKVKFISEIREKDYGNGGYKINKFIEIDDFRWKALSGWSHPKKWFIIPWGENGANGSGHCKEMPELDWFVILPDGFYKASTEMEIRTPSLKEREKYRIWPDQDVNDFYKCLD